MPLGVLELVCLSLYLLPQTAVLGAILWTGYLGGAVATHVRIGNPMFSHALFPVYVGALLWLGLWLRDARLRRLPSRRGAEANLRRPSASEHPISRAHRRPRYEPESRLVKEVSVTRRLVTMLCAVGVLGWTMMPGQASSHREAPLIAQDPSADNTDLYAFVDPNDPRW